MTTYERIPLQDVKAFIAQSNSLYGSLLYQFSRPPSVVPASLVGQELTLQLLEFYPSITTRIKGVVDEQFHEIRDWISAQFDNYKSYVINSCTDQASAKRWLSDKLTKN